MSKKVDTPLEAVNEIREFLGDRAEPIPDDIRDSLRQLVNNQPDVVGASVDIAELLYARAAEIGPKLASLGVEIALMTAKFGLHGMAVDGRGYGIADELLKKPGVAKAIKVPKKAPEVRERFRKQPLVPVAPEGPAPTSGAIPPIPAP